MKGELRFEDNNNNLVLNFTSKGSSMGTFTFRDDFQEVSLPCHGIYFRIPGDFQYDGSELHPMSLQIKCHDYASGKTGTQSAIIDIPVDIVDVGDKQSTFFDQIEEIRTNSISRKQLPYELNVNEFGDLFHSFFVYDEITYFEGRINFPPCQELVYWFSSKRPLKIAKEFFTQLNECLDYNKCPFGNHREISPMKDTTYPKHFPHN